MQSRTLYIKIKKGNTKKFSDAIEVYWSDIATKYSNNDKEKIENQWWTGRNKTTIKTGQFPVVFTKSWNGSSKSKITRTAYSYHKEKILKVKALYDYEATCEGELSISDGDIITVTNTNTGSSSWWEGTGPKGQGQFPSMYVQYFKTLYEYTARNPDELSFKAYDIIEVTEYTNNLMAGG
ncbi:hypothetical protein H8356DRAFT_1355349 [Neocallimastix lanati (nom. inval.)]|nr:hypothetical protein H8356DRAFT_1355349 [Neocallimastix sp. JGI-2020a]